MNKAVVPKARINGSGVTDIMLRDVLENSIQILDKSGIPESRALAEFCLSHLLNCGRLELVLHPDLKLTPDQTRLFAEHIARLSKGEPLQYVLGECEFFSRVFKVCPACLIPRPETELLVETVINHNRLWQNPNPKIVDAGTGSGCIAVTIACECPSALLSAVDISPPALETAIKNAALHGAGDKIVFRTGNLLDGFAPHTFDAVIANLPYVKSADMNRLDRNVRDFEPAIALDGGADGLRLVERLIEQAAHVLKPGGSIFLEIGQDQFPKTSETLEFFHFDDIIAQKDYSGITRIISAEKGD